jgi:competence protein ComEC
MGITPDSVVLSHPDGDHLGGAKAVWEAFPIRQVVLPVERSRSPAFRSWLKDAPLAGIKTIHAAGIHDLPMPDGARLEILLAPEPLLQNLTADDRVAIFMLHWRGWKLLFTNDAGIETELKLLEFKRDIAADVIIAGHHRTDLAWSDPFLTAVNPRVIIASNAKFPVSEKLQPATLSDWRARGIQVMNQAETGGVTVQVDPAGDLRLEGFVDKSVVILKPR